MGSSEVITLVSSTTDVLSDTLTGVLPIVLGIFAGLVGLGIGLRYVKKFIGRRA